MHTTFFFFFFWASNLAEGHTRHSDVFDTNFWWEVTFLATWFCLSAFFQRHNVKVLVNIFPAIRIQKKCLATARATPIYHRTDTHNAQLLTQKLTPCTVLSFCEIATEPKSLSPTHSNTTRCCNPAKAVGDQRTHEKLLPEIFEIYT